MIAPSTSKQMNKMEATEVAKIKTSLQSVITNIDVPPTKVHLGKDHYSSLSLES
jgi:hypothetical protein